MADSDKTLKLLIELGVIGKADAQAANDLLAETRATAGQTSGAVADLGNAEKKTAEEAEHLHLNHRALHQIMHLIGNETAPEMGHALAGALYGPIGIALAVGYAFEALRKNIADTNAELDKMGEKAAEAYADVKANLFDALIKEEFSTENVDKYFKKFETDADAAKTKINDMLALLREQNSAQIEKNKADEADEVEFVRKKYAGMTSSGQGAEGEKEQLRRQEEDELQAIKDRYAKKNALLTVQSEQAGVDAARAELRGLQDEQQRLYNQQNPGDSTPQARVKRSAQIADNEQELASLKDKLGIDEYGISAKGDSKRSKELHDQYDDQIAAATGYIEDQNARAATSKNPSEKYNHEMLAAAEQAELNRLLIDSGIQTADAAVAADKDRIDQVKTQTAQLKQTEEADKKLQAAIDDYTNKINAAVVNVNQTAAITDTKADAESYKVDKESQHGKDIAGILAQHPQGGASIDDLTTALGYSEGQKIALVEKILAHVTKSHDAWETLHDKTDRLGIKLDQLESSHAYSRHWIQG